MGSANGEKVVIAGAGITGMTAALYLLEAGFDVTILEKNKDVGGKFGATKGKGGAVHEHAYHFLGDWCVNFWAVAEKIGLTQKDDFLESKGVKFLRPRGMDTTTARAPDDATARPVGHAVHRKSLRRRHSTG